MPAKATTEPHWSEIRDEWETQDISDGLLAERWGFKSENSIRRMRNKEGWVRNIDAIAARIVTKAVANDLAIGNDVEAAATIARTALRTGSAQGPHSEARTPHSDAQPPGGEDSVQEALAEAKTSVRTRQERSRATADSEDLGTARHLAIVHARAIRQQVGVGDMVISTGMIIAEQVLNAMSEDPDLAIRGRQAILSINPEKETLAGAIKAIAGLLEAGVKIKRLALGMDIIKNPEGITPSQVAGGRAASKVIERLDMDTLMKLRGAAQEIARLPPPIYDGECE